MNGAPVEERNSADAHCADELVDIYLHSDFDSETECGPDERFGTIITHMVIIGPARAGSKVSNPGDGTNGILCPRVRTG